MSDIKTREYKLNGSVTVTLPHGTEFAKLGARHGENSSFRDYADVLESRKPFRTSGSLAGAPVEPCAWRDCGRLSDKWRESVRAASYIVWSWWTPVAWYVPECGWVIPAHGTAGQGVESTSTVQHMNKIRMAVTVFGGYSDVPVVPTGE